MDFTESIRRNIAKAKQDINDQVYKISIELFLSIVRRTPSPSNKGFKAKGLLANQWYPKAGSGFSSDVGTAISDTGAGSIIRIHALKGGREFYGRNGRLSLTNNLDYAYRAEMLGWPQPIWSGSVGPYRMVASSLFEIAARYK